MKNRIKDTWHKLKGLFHKQKEEKDKALFHCSDCGNDFEARDIGHYRAQHPFPSRCPQCHHMKTLPTSETNQQVYEPVWRMLETAEQTKKAREWKKLLETISAGL